MPRERITWLAFSFACGIALGWGGVPFVASAAGASAALAAAAALLALRRPGAFALVCVSAACFGAVWVDVRHFSAAPDDLVLLAGSEPRLARLRGVVLGDAERRDRTAGSMGLFGRRPPATYFTMRVLAPARGTVLVRVDEAIGPLAAGDLVDACGWLYPPRPPSNPGEFDYLRYARGEGRAGLLSVPRRELVEVSPGPRATTETLSRWRSALRRRAGGWLLANLPPTDRMRRDALLSALLLGRRGPALDGLDETFRRAGLAHVLAISGMHLGVMAGTILFLARLWGTHRRWHGWLVIGAVVLYLMIVEVRMPVLRAGLMTIAASLGVAAGRRLCVGGLVSASALCLLLWRPDQLMTPGFQLSYGVVLGLIHLAPALRARWFGPHDALAATSARMLGQWLRTACAAAATAWLVATPIALFHWGVVWPLAAPFSVVILPFVTLLLAAGCLKMLLEVVLPSAALLLAVPVSLGADVVISLVEAMDAVPFSIVHLPTPPAAWALAAEAWVWTRVILGGVLWGVLGRRWVRRAHAIAGLALLAWLARPLVPLRFGDGPVTVDMLAVGDGSCYVVRSAGTTVVFDAGSTDLDAGRRRIVPAMRRLGVRSVDAIVVSHANIDHYAAVLEITDAFDVRSVLVAPQLLREAEADPYGPVTFLLAGLSARYVAVVPVWTGCTREFGDCRWTWLHPGPRARYDKLNDASCVVRIDAPGPRRSILLCGDIEREAMEALLGSDLLAVDVAELPHHGSHHETAEAFMAATGASVVLQSTGRKRWTRTDAAWRRALPGAVRLVTARDGACRVEMGPGGDVRVGRYLEERDKGTEGQRD